MLQYFPGTPGTWSLEELTPSSPFSLTLRMLSGGLSQQLLLAPAPGRLQEISFLLGSHVSRVCVRVRVSARAHLLQHNLVNECTVTYSCWDCLFCLSIDTSRIILALHLAQSMAATFGGRLSI